MTLSDSEQETPEIEENSIEDTASEETDTETAASSDEDEPEGEAGENADTPLGDTQSVPVLPESAPPASATSTKAVAWKEDPLNFDESTIEIAITLYPLMGRPAAERVVTMCLHNHSGGPQYTSALQGELTRESALDGLQGWIARNVRQFRADLSARKQQQWEQQHKQRKQGPKGRAATASASTPVTAAPVVPTVQAAVTTVPLDDAPTPTTGSAAQPPAAAIPTPVAAKASARKGTPDLVQTSLF